ncbi:MAG TPA: TolC family protein [Spirochaetota bacterium]|nr:TolC family protein [Spirochaetota bacterium]
MNVRLLSFAGIVLLLFAGPLYPETRKLTREDCISIALENHPAVMALAQEQKKAAANYRLAKAPDRIQVSGEVKTAEYLKPESSSSGFNVPGRDTTIGIFAGASAVYNLIDPNVSRRQEAAKLAIDMARMNEIKERSTIVLNAKSAYYAYNMAIENAAVREKLRDKYRLKLETTTVLFRNGQRPILDVTKADVDLASAMLEYEKAKNQESLARTELLAALGIMEEEIDVAPYAMEELPSLRFGYEELYRLAEGHHPELRIARLNREVQRINIEVERSAGSIKVDLMASLGFENKNIAGLGEMQENVKGSNWEPTFHAGIQARVPIYTGGAITARINAAEAEYNKSIYGEKQILLGVKALLRNYVQGMEELKKQIELSRLMKINAEKHLTLAQKSYDAGVGSQLSLQDAEAAVLDAELFSVSARYEYLTILARLSKTVGVEEDYLCRK